MSRVDNMAAWVAVMIVVAVGIGSVYSNVVRYQAEDHGAIEMAVVTHDQALAMCDELGLVYDYEAEGTSVYEFCIRPELFNAQQEAQDD